MPRRSSPSPLLNLPLLIIILPIIALILLFFALPSFLSLTSHKIRLITNTTVIKTSWNSLNIFLVLFTILCGIFARRNVDESTTNENTDSINHISHVVVDNNLKRHSVSNAPWFADDISDQKIYTNTNNSSLLCGTPISTTGHRLTRSRSSYPDLRQDACWETPDDRFRFFDDNEINKHRSPILRRHRTGVFEESNVKEIPVDTFVHCSSSMLQSPPQPKTSAPPPPPPPPPTTTKSNHKQKRLYRTLPREIEKASEYDHVSTKIKTSPPKPPPPPPPRLATPAPPNKVPCKSERKKTNATKEIKMVLASLCRKKTKKQKTKVLPNNDTLRPPTEPPSFTRTPPSPPPPPPPPPPLPLIFHNLFRKNSKSKRIHFFSPPPPPPPPPPTKKRSTRHKSRVPLPPPEPPSRRKSTTTIRPPLPTKVNNVYEENLNNGRQSRLVATSPPSPPPTHKVPGFQFVLRGDFVERRSAQSSRCSPPDSEEVDKESRRTDGKDGIGGAAFCPSPDVNIKADTFIARLRDEWRLEKINSLREKGSVDQGPGTGPTKR